MKQPRELIAKLINRQRIDDVILDSLDRFGQLVLEANQSINLVSRAGDSAREIDSQIILSLAVAGRLPEPESTPRLWLDIGSGGGFPAIPLAIIFPDDRFTLVESTEKKAYFLERTAQSLKLNHVRVIAKRFGKLSDTRADASGPGGFDYLTVKAVTDWDKTLAWGKESLREGGYLITFKPDSSDRGQMNSSMGESFDLLEDWSITEFDPAITTRILLMKKRA